MCTAITYKTDSFYFGRTLDNEFSFGEKVTVTPRNYPFDFTSGRKLSSHYAIIGMACVRDDYPLYFDAANEKGLCMAGLNFVGNAFFGEEKKGFNNVAVYEFIPWILTQCGTVTEAKRLLETTNLVNKPFSTDLPTAQLHWLLSDSDRSITIENMRDGLHIFNNPVGVLANNPPFEYQMHNLNNFMNLSARTVKNHFSPDIDFSVYSKGMGAIGLPGDLSSQSRFVRAAFVKMNSVSEGDGISTVNQFFHILSSVSQVNGCNRTADGNEKTIYSACINADKGIYYYTTYGNHQISAIDINNANPDGNALTTYAVSQNEQIDTAN